MRTSFSRLLPLALLVLTLASTVAAGPPTATPAPSAPPKPPSAADNPALVEKVAADCAYDPGSAKARGKDESSATADYVFELDCEPYDFDQSCEPDPCFEPSVTCREKCRTGCTSCKTKCEPACGACKAKCAPGDAACAKACAKETLQCRQTCLDAGSTCGHGKCQSEYKTCADAADAKWKKTCAAPCDKFRACAAKCDDLYAESCQKQCPGLTPECRDRCMF